MPGKRSRRDSDRSVGSSPHVEEENGGCGNLQADGSGAAACTNSSTSSGSVVDEMEAAWQRACCMPTGCLVDGRVNLMEPDEVMKIICNNENCSVGPYMHKECFMRWEDGLLTYLRSHGRARSWSEKQRRQNLWTKKGYDLAYRACACLCNRGHLRKDVHWNPQDVAMHLGGGKLTNAEDGSKKKNRKKHKDLPALGNKYSSNSARSKSKPIPSKDNRTRTNSSSSVMSIDQGYSSSSPASTELYGGPGPAIFSPPHAGRQFLASCPGLHNGVRNPMGHGPMNSFNHSLLPEIPDNDILQDFRGRATSFSSSSPGAVASPSLSPDEQEQANKQLPGPYMNGHAALPPFRGPQANAECTVPPLPVWSNPALPGPRMQPFPDQRLVEISKMMETMGISRRARTSSCGEFMNNNDLQSPSSIVSQRMRSISESTIDSVLTPNEASSLMPSMFDFDHDAPDLRHDAEPFGHFNPVMVNPGQINQTSNFCTSGANFSNLLNGVFGKVENPAQSFPPVANFPYEYLNELKKQGTRSYCPPSQEPSQTLDMYLAQSLQENNINLADPNQGHVPLLPPQLLPENHISMMYNNMDPEKPQVIVIPGEKNGLNRRSYTEIRVIPMLTTTFKKRVDFDQFQELLQPSQVNPYHIKMEGEGYGSDDLRNFILSKLSRARCSEMNCVMCSATLPIYDHFPLLDGAMFLSPERNEQGTKRDLKMEVENKCEYIHAVCMRCLEGLHNIVCRMCKARWQGSFHQLGSLYMYDIFAASPCCQRRLCCKKCGTAIVDQRVGLKFFSEYSDKVTCPSCRATDHHFVHPASTFQLVGLVFS